MTSIVRHKVDSDAISSLGYDAEKGILVIEFSGGGSVYSYKGVPMDVYLNLMDARSMGRFVAHNIKGVYDSTKI